MVCASFLPSSRAAVMGVNLTWDRCCGWPRVGSCHGCVSRACGSQSEDEPLHSRLTQPWHKFGQPHRACVWVARVMMLMMPDDDATGKAAGAIVTSIDLPACVAGRRR